MISKHFIINDKYYLAEQLNYENWKRFTIFHQLVNKHGGSINTPLGKIEIINEPSSDGLHPHIAVNIILRNNIKRDGDMIGFDKDNKVLTNVFDIMSQNDFKAIEIFLIENNLIVEPYAIIYSAEDVQYYNTKGEIYNYD